jgi:hypothetical protein
MADSAKNIVGCIELEGGCVICISVFLSLYNVFIQPLIGSKGWCAEARPPGLPDEFKFLLVEADSLQRTVRDCGVSERLEGVKIFRVMASDNSLNVTGSNVVRLKTGLPFQKTPHADLIIPRVFVLGIMNATRG